MSTSQQKAYLVSSPQQQTITLPSIKDCLEQDEWKDFKTTEMTEEDKMEFIKATMEETMKEIQQKAAEIFWETFDEIRGYVITDGMTKEERMKSVCFGPTLEDRASV